MKHGKNSSNGRPFVNRWRPKKNETCKLIVETGPSQFELRLSMGQWIYVIHPVTDENDKVVKFNGKF